MNITYRMPVDDLPAARMARIGGAALSDAEIVSLLLTGSRHQDLETAREILASLGSSAELLTASRERIANAGAGVNDALRLQAAVELARRLAKAEIPERIELDRADKVADYLTLKYAHRDREVMGALFLDIRNRLIAEEELYSGTLNRTAVEPRRIFKLALERDAGAVILFHNHPSMDPAPSPEDIALTQRMVKAGRLMGVKVVDHLILGSRGRWRSLSRLGACS